MKNKESILKQLDDGIAVEVVSKVRANIFFDKQEYKLQDDFLSGYGSEPEDTKVYSVTALLDRSRIGTIEISLNTFLNGDEVNQVAKKAIKETIEKR